MRGKKCKSETPTSSGQALQMVRIASKTLASTATHPITSQETGNISFGKQTIMRSPVAPSLKEDRKMKLLLVSVIEYIHTGTHPDRVRCRFEDPCWAKVFGGQNKTRSAPAGPKCSAAKINAICL